MPPIRRHDLNTRDNNRKNNATIDNTNEIANSTTAGLSTNTTNTNRNAGTVAATAAADSESVRNMRKHAGTPGSAELQQATRENRRHKRVKRAQTPTSGQQGRPTRGRVASARRGASSIHNQSIAAGAAVTNSDGYTSGKNACNLRPQDREIGGINGPTPNRPKPRRLNSVMSGGRQLPTAPPTANPSQVVMNGPLSNPVAANQRLNRRSQYTLGVAPPTDLTSSEYVKPPVIAGMRAGSTNDNHNKNNYSPEVLTYSMSKNNKQMMSPNNVAPRQSTYHLDKSRVTIAPPPNGTSVTYGGGRILNDKISPTVIEANKAAEEARRLSRYVGERRPSPLPLPTSYKEDGLMSKRQYMTGGPNDQQQQQKHQTQITQHTLGCDVPGSNNGSNIQTNDLINKIVQSLLPSIQAIVETTIHNATSTSITGGSSNLGGHSHAALVPEIVTNNMTHSNLLIPNNDHNVGLLSSPRKLMDAANIPHVSADNVASTGLVPGNEIPSDKKNIMDQQRKLKPDSGGNDEAAITGGTTTSIDGLCLYSKLLSSKLMKLHTEIQDMVVQTQNKIGILQDGPLESWMAWLQPFLMREFNFHNNPCNIIVDRQGSELFKQWLHYNPRMLIIAMTMSIIPIFFRKMHQVAGAYQCGGGDIERNKKEWIGFFRLTRGILRYFLQRLCNKALLVSRQILGILPPQIETQLIQEQRIMMLKERKRLLKELDNWRESYTPWKKKLDKTLKDINLGMNLNDLDQWEKSVLIKPPCNNEVFVGGVADMCTAKEVEDYCFQQEDMFHEREQSFRKYLRSFNDHQEMCSDKLKWCLSVWNIDEEIKRERNSGGTTAPSNIGDGISTRCSIDSDYRVVQRLQKTRRSLSRLILDIR